MALDTFVQMFKPPFAWREFISQSWFVARVSIVPTLMLTIPYTVLLTFTFNILLMSSALPTSPAPVRRWAPRAPDRPDRDCVGGCGRS